MMPTNGSPSSVMRTGSTIASPRPLPLSNARPRRTAVCAALAAVVMLQAAPAWSAPPSKAAAPAQGKADKKQKTRPKGKRRIALDEDFLVEGKLEKPSAFYVLRRSSIDYDWARLDARFIPLVLESVQDPLF